MESLQKKIIEYKKRKYSRKWSVTLKANESMWKKVEEGNKKEIRNNWKRQRNVIHLIK